MHTSAGAAYGHDDDAPELQVCRSLLTLKVKEIARHVNLSFLGCKGCSGIAVETSKGYIESDIAAEPPETAPSRGRGHGRENTQRWRRMEETTHAESILCDPAKGDGTTLHRGVRRHGGTGDLQMRLLRPAPVSF